MSNFIAIYDTEGKKVMININQIVVARQGRYGASIVLTNGDMLETRTPIEGLRVLLPGSDTL